MHSGQATVQQTQHTLTFDTVRRALSLPLLGLEAQKLMAPSPRPGDVLTPPENGSREAAVLILIYEKAGAPHFVLTRRTDTVANHKGQISLPGGAHEGNEEIQDTALRETREELAVATDRLDIVGRLSTLFVTVSGFLITPIVAISPTRPAFCPDPVEVVEVIEAPLGLLVDPTVRRVEDWDLHGLIRRVPFFLIRAPGSEHKVWGATAMILAELAALLEAAQAQEAG